MSNTLSLTINGEAFDNLPDEMTVAQLLAHLKLPGKKVAVERNRAIVSKSTFDTQVLEPGDQIEIIHFIGGG